MCVFTCLFYINYSVVIPISEKMAFVYSDDDFPVLSPRNNDVPSARRFRRFPSSDSESEHSDLPPRRRQRLNYTSDEESTSDLFDLASQDVRIYLH